MAAHYRSTIADILKDFDNNQHSYEFYMDLAWEGLHDTVAWDELSIADRNNIIDTINNHKLNGNKDCNNE